MVPVAFETLCVQVQKLSKVLIVVLYTQVHWQSLPHAIFRTGQAAVSLGFEFEVLSLLGKVFLLALTELAVYEAKSNRKVCIIVVENLVEPMKVRFLDTRVPCILILPQYYELESCEGTNCEDDHNCHKEPTEGRESFFAIYIHRDVFAKDIMAFQTIAAFSAFFLSHSFLIFI